MKLKHGEWIMNQNLRRFIVKPNSNFQFINFSTAMRMDSFLFLSAMRMEVLFLLNGDACGSSFCFFPRCVWKFFSFLPDAYGNRFLYYHSALLGRAGGANLEIKIRAWS